MYTRNFKLQHSRDFEFIEMLSRNVLKHNFEGSLCNVVIFCLNDCQKDRFILESSFLKLIWLASMNSSKSLKKATLNFNIPILNKWHFFLETRPFKCGLKCHRKRIFQFGWASLIMPVLLWLERTQHWLYTNRIISLAFLSAL